ncbi:uracil phosphoribosyltransferase [Thiospirochaeta perfilievii]|uniref:Uracil phosphoribosyltransferase n=1 Tax=Thiospirochaeta perfilievii TaxID=252967 RepID=A0A5C1QHK2_9SPIO|nr:uracil phosphoribosyltransferase [Thiospirochaeta perfilievii]QEN05732.1 uracil phosphoribosyltransferase [Thiospirochaeta perfilievii]
MSNKIILKADALDGYLTNEDKKHIDDVTLLYEETMKQFKILDEQSENDNLYDETKKKIISLYQEMGDLMKDISSREENLKIYAFETHQTKHGEASRIIAKLRDEKTGHEEFVYYTQRAFELMFNLVYGDEAGKNKNHLVVKTPVTHPVQNYAVHKIPDVDSAINNTVMCVMLRGALLPSMIMSKEIQEYSSTGHVTPFALFKIKRDDSKHEADMEYLLDLDKSYFNLDEMQDKDLIFADPMNATGGSMVTVVKYLLDSGVKPRSIKFINVVSSLKGALQILRALDNITCYTLWMDPILNDKAYILPGLGDAGDRLNGKDADEYPRNMLQLVADYGTNISQLYRSQVRKIEETILG